MPAIMDFDDFFLTLPPIHIENDFSRFWKDAASSIRKVAASPEYKLNNHRSSSRFEVYDTIFSATGKIRVHGFLHLPRAVEKPHPVIIIHDYNHPEPYKGYPLDEQMAYFFLQLRGHDHIRENQPRPQSSAPAKSGAKTTAKQTVKIQSDGLPGYLSERILDPDQYYVKGIFCDLLKAIDVLRLNRKIDCSSIGILGKGLGAGAALFAAGKSSRVSALVLDSPTFCHLDLELNSSRSAIAREITRYIDQNPAKRALVKRSLSYFDALAHSHEITCPVMLATGLRDDVAPAKCSMALFNHLQCDKEVQVYPDDGNDCGGERQFKKALFWMKKKIYA